MSESGHGRTTRHVRGDGSFPRKRPIRVFSRRWRPMSSEPVGRNKRSALRRTDARAA